MSETYRLFSTNREPSDAAVKRYRDIKAANSKEFDSGEDELNLVGYELLRIGNIKFTTRHPPVFVECLLNII